MRWLHLNRLQLAALGLLLAGMLAGVVLDRAVLLDFKPPQNLPAGAEEEFELLAEAWNTIERRYVEQELVSDQRLAHGALEGMVEALGDTGHSRFLGPAERRAHERTTAGSFEGIGIEVELQAGQLTIIAPIDDSPAERAGLQSGEVILAVDGQGLENMTLDEMLPLIQGPAGSRVTLTLLNQQTDESREVTLVRQRIAIHSVSWQPVSGTSLAHVRIAAFTKGVNADLTRALKEIQQAGLSGLILDLRNNPGGLLDEATGVASQFLSSGNVLLVKDAQGQMTPVPVRPGGLALDLPMVVLINNGSASASEIVSGALQDQHRATLVGQTTFGTGTVLYQFPLSDGSALLLATELWLTPAGRVIWHRGIMPDRQVELPQGVRLLRPRNLAGLTLEQIRASGDQQFNTALDLLRQR